MKKIVAAVLLCFVFLGQAPAKEKKDYLYLVTITKATGKQQFIYTDFFVLSGASTASHVQIWSKVSASGDQSCDSHMKVAVKGSGLHINEKKKQESLENVNESWDIAWDDKLTIMNQEYKRLFTVTKQECPFPLIRSVPDRE